MIKAGEAARWEWYLAWAAVAAACLAAMLAWMRWFPAFNNYDESSQLAYLQLWREGNTPFHAVTQGCLHRYLLMASCLTAGFNLDSLHWPALLLFIAESLLLARLCSSLFGSRAAAWALLCNAVAAFTVVRLRSLLSYTAAPFELLFFWVLMLQVRKPMAAAIWGAGLMLLTLDYEVWMGGVPLFLALFAFTHRQRQLRLACLAGASFGLALVTALSWDSLEAWFKMRLVLSGPTQTEGVLFSLGDGLKTFWMGGFQLPFFGASGHSAFPYWALALFFWGAWKLRARWPQGIAFALLAMLPLLARESGQEPQRAILAWPLLCVISGAGAAAAFESAPRLSRLLLPLLLLFGLGNEALALKRSWVTHDSETYGIWRDWMGLAGRHEAGGFLSNLGGESGPVLRFLSRSQAGDPALATVALLPRNYAASARRIGGKVEDGGGAAVAWFPPEKALPSVRSNDQELDSLYAAVACLGPLPRQQWLQGYLEKNRSADPWLRGVAWDLWFFSGSQIRVLPPALVGQALSEPLISARVPLEMADKLLDADPAASLQLSLRALQIDPDSQPSRALAAEARRRLQLGSNALR